uniref:Uncharacterized protein n=1 Tax=Setaria digitata TaxID=48799 RepID=A0A915PHV5_9BILA
MRFSEGVLDVDKEFKKVATVAKESLEECQQGLDISWKIYRDVYLDGLREQKKATEDVIGHLKKDRELIARQIEEMRMKLSSLDTRIGKEEEICSRLERTISHANETYEKLVESSQSLVDYVKKEYEGARSSGSSFT